MKKLYCLLSLVLFLTLQLIDAEMIELKIPKKEAGVYGNIACKTEGNVCNVQFNRKNLEAEDIKILSEDVEIFGHENRKVRIESKKYKKQEQDKFSVKIFEKNEEVEKFIFTGEIAKLIFGNIIRIYEIEKTILPGSDDNKKEICDLKFNNMCEIEIDKSKSEITDATFIVKNVSIIDPTDLYKNKEVTLRLQRSLIGHNLYNYNFSIIMPLDQYKVIFQQVGTATDYPLLVEIFQQLSRIFLQNRN